MRLLFATLFLAACSADTFAVPDGSLGDGGAEGGGDACSIVPSTCAAGHLCANFDDGKTDQFVAYVVGDANESVTSDVFHSCPNGLAATLGAEPDGGVGLAFGGVVGTLPVKGLPTAGATLSTQVFLPQTPPGAFIFFLTLSANQNTQNNVGLAYVGGQWQLRSASDNSGIDPLVGAWNPITLKATFTADGTSGTAELDYTDSNGEAKTANVQMAPLTTPGGITSLEASVGAGAIGSTTNTMRVTYDDLDFWSP